MTTSYVRPVRYVLEGEWSGYTSAQRRIVHRSVHKGSERRLREWAEKHHGIRYTDGTMLYISVRDCKPRERVKDLKNGYMNLIRECVFQGVSSVTDLKRDKQ